MKLARPRRLKNKTESEASTSKLAEPEKQVWANFDSGKPERLLWSFGFGGKNDTKVGESLATCEPKLSSGF